MSQIIKKIFSSFVTMMTILSSVGFGALVAPGTAHAATLMAGDLIKASTPAVYYYAGDQKRYVFPNEKTYYSWYQNFSSVKIITDAELAAIMIGGNVTIRPGTKLVKITTDPKTYAVAPGGVLRWIESEAVAIALYGSSWAQRVVDVPDGFFVNYTVGSSIPTAVHPDGTLVSYAGASTRYLVEGGQKRMIASDAAFAANGWNASNVIQTSVVYPAGADVTGMIATYANVVAAGGSVTPVGGSVVVSLASDTPAGMTTPKNASSVQLAKFNVTAGSASALITGLRVHRIGVGATTDFSNVYLYDSNGMRLTSGRTVNSTSNLVEFNSLNVTVAAGQTVSFVITGDFSTPSTTGGQHGFEIQDAASVVISGSGSVSGSFPVRGNVFTVGTTSAARVDVQKGTQPTNPNIGAMDVEISNFKLVANTNDVEVRRVTVLQAGSITNTDLSNLTLYQGVTPVATAAALSGDKIVLNFNPPYVMTNGTTKVFSLRSKVLGRASRTIKTYVEYTTDVYAVDKVYNSGAAICIAATAIGGCSAASQGSFDGNSTNYIEVTTQGGQLTLAFNGPATQNVAKAAQDVALFNFSITSPDNDLEIRNMDIKIAGATSNDLVKGSAGTEYFRDIKIKNMDTKATVMGPTSMSSSLASSSTNTGIMTLSDSFTLKAGTTMNLSVTADIANSNGDVAGEFAQAGTHKYNVVFADSDSALFGTSDVRIISTGEFLAQSKIVPNSAITGNNTTVKASSLDVSLAGSPSSNTVVKKQANVPAVGFVFTAGAQSDLLVTSVVLTARGNTDATYTLANADQVITSCGLFDGLAQVGVAQSPDTTLGTMNITNMNLTIAKGTSKTLVVQCTADSTITQTNGDLFAVGIATASTDVTAQDGDSNTVTATLSTGVTTNAGASPTVTQTVRSSGTLTVATDNLRQATTLVAGGDVWQNLAQFKATAQYEAIDLTRITVSSTGDAADFTAIAISKDGAVKGSDVLPSGAYKNRDIDLTSNPISVPKDGSATFQIWAKLANTQSSSSVSGSTTGTARSGHVVALGLGANINTGEWDSGYTDKYNIRATGAASGERVYATSSNMTGGVQGNSFVIRKSKPTVTRQALSTATLTSGQDQDLYKFQVSADSAGSISLKKFVMNLSITTSSGSTLTLSNLRLRRGSSDMGSSDIRIVDSSVGADLYSGSWTYGSTTGRIVVSFASSEETISGSGNIYTLHGTIGGSVVSGDSVSLSFKRQTTGTVSTGYITSNSVTSTNGVAGPNINTSANGADTSSVDGTFVWSDQSEVPHSAASVTSRDWTDDLYVEDLTQTSVLSR